MKNTFKVSAICKIAAIRRIAIIALVAVIEFSFTSCVAESIDNSSNNGGGSSGGRWLINKTTTYTITDGVAGAVYSETERNWISYRYRNDTDYEGKYTEGSSTFHYIKNGQNYTSTTESPTGTTTYIYLTDLSTGLNLEYKTNISGTTTEYLYTLQLLSDIGGVKTYKHYITNTGGTGQYSEYTFQNGKTQEIKGYSSLGVLSSSQKYTYFNNMTVTEYYDANSVLYITHTSTFPIDAAIHSKLPNFSLSSTDYPSTPLRNYFETVDVLLDTSSSLALRVKRFNSSNVLSTQTDYLYIKL